MEKAVVEELNVSRTTIKDFIELRIANLQLLKLIHGSQNSRPGGMPYSKAD